MGSEDFAYYQEVIPGVMFMLGCEQENITTGSLHESILNFMKRHFNTELKFLIEIANQICGK